MALKEVVVIVSGLAASGKSTVSKKIAETLGLERYSGGEALKVLAAKLGFNTSGNRWWESDEGMRFLSMREGNEAYDRMVDEELLRLAKRGRVVIDSWVLPWLYEGGFKVWLKADKQTRAERLSLRTGLPLQDALKILEERDKRNSELYKRLYGVSLGADLTPFHLVIDTSRLTTQEVFEITYLGVKYHYDL
ncbi:MAG: cytidylate kinase family protein [Nitrososphaerota archaeon]